MLLCISVSALPFILILLLLLNHYERFAISIETRYLYAVGAINATVFPKNASKYNKSASSKLQITTRLQEIVRTCVACFVAAVIAVCLILSRLLYLAFQAN